MITSQTLMTTSCKRASGPLGVLCRYKPYLWALLLTTVLSSACSSQRMQVPFCVPDRPQLESLSVEEQRALHSASPEGLLLLARNDIQLKAHLSSIEQQADRYNKELKLGECGAL